MTHQPIAVQHGSIDPKDLWFLMHSSDDPNRSAFVLTCYLDDSGTHDASPVVAIGGCVLDRRAFLRLDSQWKAMLRTFRIDLLHMTDFVRPHGRYIGMFKEMKLALFRDAAKIINARKDYSISVSIDHAEYKECFPEGPYRQTLGPYTVAFITAAQYALKITKDNRLPARVAYLVDRGSPVSDQLDLGHKLMVMQEMVSGDPTRIGSLTFESDEYNTALQAADVVAWASRRKVSSEGLRDEFEPLMDIFKARFTATGVLVRPHFHQQVKQALLSNIIKRISTNEAGLRKEVINLINAARATIKE